MSRRLFHAVLVLAAVCSAAPRARSRAAQLPITVDVDAREAPRGILHARLAVPASPGPLTLLYPQWIPGEHGPTGPINSVTGLTITAGGRPVAWRRDPVDMYAFHCTVPEGADALEIALDFTGSNSPSGFTGGASTTPHLAVISWNELLLYPAGRPAREIACRASMRLPEGWKFGTALPIQEQDGETIRFQPAPLETLVDSPVLSGSFFRAVPLSKGKPPHELDMASDSPEALEMTPEVIADCKRLVAETDALFGARHYRDYHFLLTLSDHVAHFGLEHHESSDDRVGERTLIGDAKTAKLDTGGLLAHEMTHSWNGKYRRPTGLATPDYRQPMQGELLWVYEGLTTYLGNVLSARSGFATPKQYREMLAGTAAFLDHRTGRAWRPLIDTTVAAQLLYVAPGEWSSSRRGTDFYPEGELIWLEADTLIRQRSHGERSLDDFCRKFFGGESGAPEVKPYTFEDLVAALDAVQPYDWREFFSHRLNSTEPRAPLGGLRNGGWELSYNGTAPDLSHEPDGGGVDLMLSIGAQFGSDGRVGDVIPGMPAARAGLTPGMKLVAVDGRKWNADRLKAAVKGSTTSKAPLELLVENAEFYQTLAVDYHDGERHPHLKRVDGATDLLDEIVKPHAPG